MLAWLQLGLDLFEFDEGPVKILWVEEEDGKAVSTRARRDLPWPRAFSAQATQAQRAWFQTRRYVWFMLTR